MTPDGPRPTRLPVRELALAAASLAVLALVLLVGELVLRRLSPPEQDPQTGLALLHRFSPVFGWEPRPGVRLCDAGWCATINEQGYRGVPLGPRSAGRRRVVLLGDSVTFGFDVADAETFAGRLGAMPGYEAANLGVQGYGPDQSLLRLETLGLPLRPDIVVLNVCLDNDFADAALPHFLYGPQPKPYFELVDGALVKRDAHLQLGPMGRSGLWLQERSALFRAALAPAGRMSGRRAPHWNERRRASDDEREARIALVLALVRRMREVAEGGGARLVVALHPNAFAFRQGGRLLEAFRGPELAGIPVVDLREAYRARGLAWRDVAVDTIGHLSRRGHQEAADALREAIDAAYGRGPMGGSP